MHGCHWMQAASGAAGRANVGCSAVHLVVVSGVSSTSRSAEPRLTAYRCPRCACRRRPTSSCQAKKRYPLQAPALSSKPAAAAVDGRRRTDTRTLHRPCLEYHYCRTLYFGCSIGLRIHVQIYFGTFYSGESKLHVSNT